MSSENDLELKLWKLKRNEIAHLSPDQVKQYTLHFDSAEAENVLLSTDHHIPAEFIKRSRMFPGGGGAKDVVVRTGTNSRRIYVRTGSGKLIATKEMITEPDETLSAPLEEYQAQSAAQPSLKPPLNAEYVLHLFLKRDERDAVIGDLLERYARNCERFGERRARLWIYGEVVRSIWPLMKRIITKASGLIALGEWIRRHVS